MLTILTCVALAAPGDGKGALECQNVYDAAIDALKARQKAGEFKGTCEMERARLAIFDKANACLASFNATLGDRDDEVKAIAKCEERLAEAKARDADDARREAEKSRAAEASKQKRQEAIADPEFQKGAASSALCFFAELKTKTSAQIASEKKRNKDGGSEHVLKMNELQEVVRLADEGSADAKKILAKRKPIACTDVETATRAYCYGRNYRGSKPDSDKRCAELGSVIDMSIELIPKLARPMR